MAGFVDTLKTFTGLDSEASSRMKVALEDVSSFVSATATRPLDRRIAFVHIPKCAGTSVDFALRRLYRSAWDPTGKRMRQMDPGATSEVAEVVGDSTWEVRRNIISYYLGRPDLDYVTGHFQVDRPMLERFATKFAFVTILRDPVKRFISHYFHNTFTDPDHRFHIDEPLEEFVETERARGVGQMFLAYLSGTGDMPPDERGGSEEILEEAKENLECFEVVGCVEEMERFCEKMRERLGADINPLRRNVSKASKERKREAISDAVRERIAEVCAPDLELYDYARQLS